MPMTGRAELFETRPCGRCGGSGWFSYCQTWGHTCFQCGVRPGERGLGRYLTRRGAAAHAFYLSLLPSKRAADLAPGDAIREYGRWLEVVAVGDNAAERATGIVRGDGTVDYSGRNIRVRTNPVTTFCGVPDDARYVVRPTEQQRADALRAALEYQGTLTKLGKPRKGKTS